MGNLMQDGAGAAHGVLYRLRCLDFATLTHMEHEYRSVEDHSPSSVLLNGY